MIIWRTQWHISTRVPENFPEIAFLKHKKYWQKSLSGIIHIQILNESKLVDLFQLL